MSNPLSIAAVTATLRNLLMGVTINVPDATVTTKPPHKARHDNDNGNQLNLFLYQTALNAAWQKKQAGEDKSPLGLNLYYLVTVYGRNDDDILSHRLLGEAMSILHKHAVLSADEMKAALPDNDLHEQSEQVRITPHPLSSEELAKLWNTFQTPYGISAAYQVSVVLMTSQRPTATTRSAMERGSNHGSLIVQPQLRPACPTLTRLQFPNPQAGVQPGDILTLQGHSLDGDKVVVHFRSLRFPDVRATAPLLQGNATTLKVQLPTTPTSATSWPVAFCALAAVIGRVGEPERTTNELPFLLAPRILGLAPNPASQEDQGPITLTLTCRPSIQPEQPAVLLLGDREIPAQPHPTTTEQLQFLATGVPPGQYALGLRVDGIDGLPADLTVTLLHADQ